MARASSGIRFLGNIVEMMQNECVMTDFECWMYSLLAGALDLKYKHFTGHALEIYGCGLSL